VFKNKINGRCLSETAGVCLDRGFKISRIIYVENMLKIMITGGYYESD